MDKAGGECGSGGGSRGGGGSELVMHIRPAEGAAVLPEKVRGKRKITSPVSAAATTTAATAARTTAATGRDFDESLTGRRTHEQTLAFV